ncbi:hypothetical protein RF11_14412 [Thelohanellus kitauei]|uniref:Uncharacterized protein n=1 Tax=Thelohanellus kitauei TaxID=669202 RepID=A0A0C2IYC3_THEKT|nr:hypothetical protein RF11_14412 [Thelohanellus kitauei]
MNHHETFVESFNWSQHEFDRWKQAISHMLYPGTRKCLCQKLTEDDWLVSTLKGFKFDRFDENVEEWTFYINRFELALRKGPLIEAYWGTPFPVCSRELSRQRLRGSELKGGQGAPTKQVREENKTLIPEEKEESIGLFLGRLRTLASKCEFTPFGVQEFA